MCWRCLVQEKRVHLSVPNEMEVKHLSNITKLNDDKILMVSFKVAINKIMFANNFEWHLR